MTPEEKARSVIDAKLQESGWVLQNMKELNLSVSAGVAVREYPTSSGPADYVLFVDGEPAGVIEAKKSSGGENITAVEEQSARYAHSTLKYINHSYRIRFVYEATDRLVRFTDYDDISYRSREIFSFYRPETLRRLLKQQDTLRNSLKQLPTLDPKGLRDCQVTAIQNLDQSFAENRPRALVQMATGAGKTFTAITAVYRLLKYGRMNRILFLVDTTNLGEQAESEFRKYRPVDDTRSFAELYEVCRLTRSFIPDTATLCISTIQRMYSILKGEPLDAAAEETSFFEYETADTKPVKEVVYNAKYPPEFFDCIIVDECHRSIYNVWSQVLTYFDTYIVGLTATPDKRTFAFFKENIVSEYSREQAICDGVNVGEDVFLIETNITKNGAHLEPQILQYRDRLSRETRWEQLDEELDYKPNRLDQDIVNKSQIRTVIRAFRDSLFTQLFPDRREVPKTLIFAKTDSHADDIVEVVREEFGEGNEFCKKLTYATEKDEDPRALLGSFRNGYNPRIVVTVDMIATGTDVKAIECLLFMRDVRSRNYFEQMKGRGTRVLSTDELVKVSPSATSGKDHFVIVDAVGVTKSKKSEARTLEYKHAVPLKELMLNVATGSRDPETLTSLANRIIRLATRLSASEQKDFTEAVGKSPGKLASDLLNAFDPDVIQAKAQHDTGSPVPDEAQLQAAQEELITQAVAPFQNPKVRDYVENVRKRHEQIMDDVNPDTLVYAGFDTNREEKAVQIISGFRSFIEENRNEIIVLRILYDQRYLDRPMSIEQLKALYEKLRAKGITVERLWDAYGIQKPDRVKKCTMAQLTDLIALIRFEMGYTDQLEPFADRVNYNFMQWTLRRNAGAVHFTEDQMEWLRLIKEHIIASLSILPEDLDLTPFDSRGGLIRFYEAFGNQYLGILDEMNRELVA